ncbi:MAG: Uncharacterised protein [Synechococcus sp. MIT S9220]|nr:MAG: Uncharacterised protein [Synechococcus sp. MIT S9220]
MPLVLEKGDVLLSTGSLQPGQPRHQRLGVLCTQVLVIVGARQALHGSQTPSGPQHFREAHRQSNAGPGCALLEKLLQCGGRALNDLAVEAGDLRIDHDRLGRDSAVVELHPLPQRCLSLLAFEVLQRKLVRQPVTQQLIGLRGIRDHQVRA